MSFLSSILESQRHAFKLFLLRAKRFPITSCVSVLLTISFVALFYTWPGIGLFQYALGFTSGLSGTQLGLLAAQYGSALSFWGALTLAIGVVATVSSTLSMYLVAVVGGISTGTKYQKLKQNLQDPAVVSDFVDDLLISPEYMTHLTTATFAPDLLEKISGTTSIEGAASLIEPSLTESAKDVCMGFIKPIIEQLSSGETFFFSSKGPILQRLEQEVRDRYVPAIMIKLKASLQSFVQSNKHVLGSRPYEEEFTNKHTNPYEVLNIHPTASNAEITKAYRARSMQTHPDKNNGRSTEFKQVKLAYDFLSSDLLSANVDKWMGLNPARVRNPEPAQQPTVDNNNQPKPVTRLPADGHPYWKKQYDKLQNKTWEDIVAQRRTLKQERNDLLASTGFNNEALLEKLDELIATKSALCDENGALLEDPTGKQDAILQALNLKAQIAHLRETKYHSLNHITAQFPSNLDHQSLEKQEKVIGKKKIA